MDELQWEQRMEFKAAVAGLLVNLKNWNFDFDYRLSKQEAEVVQKMGKVIAHLSVDDIEEIEALEELDRLLEEDK